MNTQLDRFAQSLADLKELKSLEMLSELANLEPIAADEHSAASRRATPTLVLNVTACGTCM